MDRASLLNRKSGRIAIAVPFQASRVIPLVLCVGQRLGFGGSQLCIVTSLLSVLARREVALLFGVRCLFRFRGSEFGVIALVPSVVRNSARCAGVLRWSRPSFPKQSAGNDRRAPVPFLQSDALSCCLAVSTAPASDGLSFEWSQAPTPSLQSATLRRCSAVDESRASAGVSLERSQELHPIVAIGHIALMIGDGQRHSFGFGELCSDHRSCSRSCSSQRCARGRRESRPPIPLGSTLSDRSSRGPPCSSPGSAQDPMTERMPK